MAKDTNLDNVLATAVPVRVISQQGAVILVEYTEDKLPARVLVPAAALQGDTIASKVLQAGIPMSVRWDKVIQLNTSTAHLAKCLYDAGLFTPQDVLANPAAVQGALQAAMGVDLGKLFATAENMLKER